MEEIYAETWVEFENTIEEIQKFRSDKSKETKLAVSELLFRGQADSSWKLNTTLERYTNNIISLKKYHNYLERIKPAIETYTDLMWDLGDASAFNSEIISGNIPGYSLMIYARHHGFPSPLIDWTLSPYIALYFALSTNSDSKYSAIYAYIETPNGIKSGWRGGPKIIGLGQYSTSHERHFTQQAQYTIFDVVYMLFMKSTLQIRPEGSRPSGIICRALLAAV
jgi:hypothetical protein